MAWDWSGGVAGKGTRDDFFEVLGATWQKMVSNFEPTNIATVVDTQAGKIYTTFTIELLLDGHGAVPAKDSIFSGRNFFEFDVDKDGKINYFKGRWDSNGPSLNKMIGAIMAAGEKK